MKPYPEHKDSGVEWIGEIPSHWIPIKPKYHLNRVTRNPMPEDNIITCFRDGEVTLRKNRRTEGFTNSLKEIGYQRIHIGDLVVHEMDAFEGSIGVSDSTGKSTPVYTVIEKHYSYDVNYWKYLLRVMSQTGFIESLARSIRERTTEFRWNMWGNIYFYTPTVSEQTQIANFLDTKTQQIEKLIQNKEQKIKLLQEKRTAVINHAVTKGLNPDVEMKDSGVEWIGKIPVEWNMVRLKFLGESIIGLSYKPTDIVDGQSQGVLVLRSSNIQNRKLSLNDCVYVNTEVPEKLIVREGDILICSRSGSRELVGKNITIDSRSVGCTFGVFMTIFRSSYWKFISCFLNSPIFENQSGLFTTSTINQLTTSTLNNMHIPFPSNTLEQSQIANYLEEKTQQIDDLIGKEQRKIELLKEYRQSLISDAVTGKIDVREAV